MNYQDDFGKQGRDKVTGFTGTIAGICIYAYGCEQYLISPKVDKDGKLPDGQWMDVSRIEVLAEPKIKGLKGKVNGCDSCKPSQNH